MKGGEHMDRIKSTSRFNRLIMIEETGEIFKRVIDCANAIGCSPQNVSHVICGDNETCYGYHLKIIDDDYHDYVDQSIWKEHPYIDGIFVSKDGRVLSCRNGFIKEQVPFFQLGYYYVTLYKNKYEAIHRLVAETYIPNPYRKPEVNHIDGNKLNNNVWNLEWVTRDENQYHAYKTGLRKRKNRIPVRIVETGEEFDSLSSCARAINGDEATIWYCLSGKRYKSHKGYHFEYI